jgi:hypothetical protein
MTELKSKEPTSQGDDPLAHLHKMSTTAGLGTTEYVAVNGMSIVALILGVASALSLFANELLVIPILAIALAFVAFHQIKNSNGTQTGKGLAALGLVFALGFMVLVGGRLAFEIMGNRADEKAIDELISQCDQDLRAGKYHEAYQMFTGKFTSTVKEQNFTDTWKRIVDGTKDYPGLTNIRSNGRMEFDISPETGQPIAVCMSIMEFGPKAPAARIPYYFQKNPDGSWKISNIPDLFKPQQPPQTPTKVR